MSKVSAFLKQLSDLATGSPAVAVSVCALGLLGYLVYAASGPQPQDPSFFFAFIGLCVVVAIVALAITKTICAHLDEKKAG